MYSSQGQGFDPTSDESQQNDGSDQSDCSDIDEDHFINGCRQLELKMNVLFELQRREKQVRDFFLANEERQRPDDPMVGTGMTKSPENPIHMFFPENRGANSSNIREFISRQSTLVRKILLQTYRVKMLENITDLLTNLEMSKTNLSEIDGIKELAGKQWEQFLRYHEKILDEAPESLCATPYFVDDTFHHASQLYSRIVRHHALIKEKLIDRDREKSTKSSMRSSSKSSRINTRDSEQYGKSQSFGDLQSTVGSSRSINAADKFSAMLKACVNGSSASSIASGVASMTHNVPLNSSGERNGNYRKIMSAQMNRILNLRPITKNSSRQLLNIVDTINAALSAMKELGAPTEFWDIPISQIAHKLLDTEAKDAWDVHLGSRTDIPTLRERLEFLQSRAMVLRRQESIPRQRADAGEKLGHSSPGSSRNSRAHQQSAHTSQSQHSSRAGTPPPGKKKCSACHQNHWLGPQCKRFSRMDLNGRKEFLIDKELCFNCFGPHRVAKCSSVRRCKFPGCNEKHHTMIHD